MSTMTAVRINRTIAAAPERVYRAWLDPELLRRWIAPYDRVVTHAEVEERPGGRFAIYQEGEGASIGGMESEIVELEPNRRIVFNWRFVGPQREIEPGLDSRLTITFEPVAEGTELTLVHERLDAFAAAHPEIAPLIETGWGAVLDKLPAALS
jgi:uncharacterized protein YndB with AHSA1/START domain